ncbi:MAG: DNA polymerase IV [Eubacteriales bacterium]|nr:DNA polymerase IV [Eubacteriales bacterium]
MADRTILHIDMNGCYASIECLHNPAIRDLPVAVGGDVESRHGIILAKNQIAKAYDIKTGEALWQARQKCPNLVILQPHYGLYWRFSKLARAIYEDYSSQIEPFGLDEAWVDVTGSTHLFGDGYTIAEEIRARVERELGITVSVGVSFNKVFAKLGSDYKKPNAVTEFSRSNFKKMVWPLPVGDLLYVGRATQRKLYARGIMTIGQLAAADPVRLHQWFGKCGYLLYAFANGEDRSQVMQCGEEALVKSIGNATTTPRDLVCEQDASVIYYMLAESVAERLREQGLMARTVQIHLRDNGLFCFERQMKLSSPTCLAGVLHEAAMTLLRAQYDWSRPLRTVGIRATELTPATSPQQLRLFEDEAQLERMERLERSIDDIRRRFGHYAICRAVCTMDKTLANINPKDDHNIHPVGFFKPSEDMNGAIGSVR